MLITIDDYGEQCQFNDEGQDDGFWYRIADVRDVMCFLNDEVNDTHEHSVETEDGHGADGDVDDDLGFESVCATPKVDNGEDGEETNNEVEGDVNDCITLIDMPIEEDETKGEGGNANEEIFFEASLFQIAGLTQ